ncbi:MAG: GTP 3',8-cyclase MoaA [Gemmatimonadales bacterium]
MTGDRDTMGRPLKRLRISVTDRCNMRCRYCMPEDEYVWLPRSSILTFEETTRLARVFVSLGVTSIRLTGGEPLLRHDLATLVGQLRSLDGLDDLSMTTNAVLLARHAGALRSAGLDRLTVSLDTLRPERLLAFAKSDRWDSIVEGLREARRLGFRGTKINTVVIRGFNDDELYDLIEFGRTHQVEIRFIEYMDVGGATQWTIDQVVSRDELLGRLEDHYGSIRPATTDPTAPAERYQLVDGTTFGIIASTTQPFCATCDRSRLTADGTWYTCLYAAGGMDLRELVRGGASDADLVEQIAGVWRRRTDRGAEERLALADRSTLYPVESLRADPRREMHTRGG